jgi:hypothetical protein
MHVPIFCFKLFGDAKQSRVELQANLTSYTFGRRNGWRGRKASTDVNDE